MDSLDLVELVMDAERKFGVSFPDEAAAELRHATAADVWRLLVELQTGSRPGGRPTPGDPTWRELRIWLARLLDVPADDVSPERRLDQ